MHETKRHFDVIIIGAGIAGVSMAAELSSQAKVLLLEMEAHPGHHATGRSAAYFAPSYGNEVIRAFTEARSDFYKTPNNDFEGQLLRPRDALFVANQEQQSSVEEMLREQPNLKPLNLTSIQQRVPILNQTVTSGLLDETGGDLDVDLIMQGLLKQLKRNNGLLVTGARVQSMIKTETWQVNTIDQNFWAPVIVNAAGAWADDVANLAGISSLGLQPLKRTALLVDPPAENIEDWPLVVDIDEEFYFKPDAGKLLLSPADETLTEPMDVHPDELDVAIAVDRICQVTSLKVTRVNHQWAGLRTFAPDRTLVIGFDERTDGFFWLAGQGGYGVQTAPGVAKFAAEVCLNNSVSTQFQPWIDAVHPRRLISQSG